MGRLIDKIEEHEREAATLKTEKKPPVVLQMSGQSKKASGKDKQISAKVNSETYALFADINRVIGLSNNSALNMLITNYVCEKKYLLDQD